MHYNCIYPQLWQGLKQVQYKLSELVALFGGQLVGDDISVTAIAPTDFAANNHITFLSDKKYKKALDAKEINLDIEIAPYTNRVIIPKIGKNIPLLDVKNRNIEWQNELNDIFMKELEKWIIRYPGSALPGEEWVSFIFGHSSNLPWMKWDYNNIFATLDQVQFWDEVIVYYGQEKYTYKIREKKVIKPGDVSVLKRNNDKSEISIMTCWPIWTTINRLIVTWELVKND